MKLYFSILLFIFLSGCFHETSLISNYGQSIVKVPNQTEAIDDLNTGKNVNNDHGDVMIRKNDSNTSSKGINISGN